MAKKRKYPKQPKASSSIEVWNRYLQKCKEVAAHNKALSQKPQKIASIKQQVSKLK